MNQVRTRTVGLEEGPREVTTETVPNALFSIIHFKKHILDVFVKNIFWHHPISDPVPSKLSNVTNRNRTTTNHEILQGK